MKCCCPSGGASPLTENAKECASLLGAETESVVGPVVVVPGKGGGRV